MQWGSGRKNSNHHPEAVYHPLDRACPWEIRKGEMVLLGFSMELFYHWPLIAEEKQKGSSK
jgi:hypothetical protein